MLEDTIYLCYDLVCCVSASKAHSYPHMMSDIDVIFLSTSMIGKPLAFYVPENREHIVRILNDHGIL